MEDDEAVRAAASVPNFRDLYLHLDVVVDIAREASDTIAERMRALNRVPDGRTDTVVASTTLPSMPGGENSTDETVDLMTNRIYAAVDTMRSVHDDIDEADPSSADLLHAIIDSLVPDLARHALGRWFWLLNGRKSPA